MQADLTLTLTLTLTCQVNPNLNPSPNPNPNLPWLYVPLTVALLAKAPLTAHYRLPYDLLTTYHLPLTAE